MKWGIFEIVKLDKEKWECEIKYQPENKKFSKKPMINWLNKDPMLNIEVKVMEYDHLLTCRKPDGDKDFKDYVNKNSKFET